MSRQFLAASGPPAIGGSSGHLAACLSHPTRRSPSLFELEGDRAGAPCHRTGVFRVLPAFVRVGGLLGRLFLLAASDLLLRLGKPGGRGASLCRSAATRWLVGGAGGSAVTGASFDPRPVAAVSRWISAWSRPACASARSRAAWLRSSDARLSASSARPRSISSWARSRIVAVDIPTARARRSKRSSNSFSRISRPLAASSR